MSDYYSKLPFVYAIPSPVTSAAVISKMKSLFAEQGVPQRVVSDNGGHFSSDAFKKFTDQWCFDHVTSSPHYPQSNGHIERHIQTVKRMLKKIGPRSDIQMALLVLRATPIDSHLPSPAELLYGRRVVSNLPVAISNASGSRCASTNDRPLPRCTMTPEESRTFLYSHEDRSSTHATHRWEPAGIVNACLQPRSYDVESTSGRILRRNRRDIRETTEQHLLLLADDDDPRRDENPKRSEKSISDSSVDARDPPTPQRQTTVRYVEPTRTRSGRIIHAPPRLDL